MSDWIDPQTWITLFDQIRQWLELRVFNYTSLVQLAAIGSIFVFARTVAAWLVQGLRKLENGAGRVQAVSRVFGALISLSIPLGWLLMMWSAIAIANQYGLPHPLMTLVASLLSAWVVIRTFSHLVDDAFWSQVIALTAWLVAALNIVGLLDATLVLLDQAAVTMGDLRVSLLTLIQGGAMLALLLWIAAGLSGVVERQLVRSRTFTPAARVLVAKIARLLLFMVAILVALNSLGIDLTAFAVFSGALGVGLGFGLQKIFSNLVSGVILLLDKSIKPGDVIAVGNTYGWINHLGARYVSVITRDGIEHLIPNEELITQRVENWSHTHNLVRLRIPIGISYGADPRLAMKLGIEAAEMVPRVLLDPTPKCLMVGFGDSSINLELRIWISDPQEGRMSVVSEVLLGVWDRFHEAGVEIPFPQRDLHLKGLEGLIPRSSQDTGSPAPRGGD